jgi:hypothetical protein
MTKTQFHVFSSKTIWPTDNLVDTQSIKSELSTKICYIFSFLMSVGQMSVGRMFVSQMSVGEMY